MNFHDVSVSILMSLSALLGVGSYPEKAPEGWNIEKKWETVGSYYLFTASSDSILKDCDGHPDNFLQFPPIIHGSHYVLVDGKVISTFGEKSFDSYRSFYGAPLLKCADVPKVGHLEWQVYSYTRYFARINFLPKVVVSKPLYNFFAESFNIIAAGGIYLLGIFCLLFFLGKAPNDITVSLVLSCFGFSNYFFSAGAGILGIDAKMLTMHKFADISVLFGIGIFVNALRIEGILSWKLYRLYFFNILIACLIILFGSSGDVIQVGTTLPMPFTVGIVVYSLVKLFKRMKGTRKDKTAIFQAASFTWFVVSVCNEIFVVTGLVHGIPLLSIGMMGGMLFFALAVNIQIISAYEERDYLRSNLENEVVRQTAEIRTKSEQLEAAMSELKHTQAELVQSAKLASLGTLSAGIAHEINNSLNYVNGSLVPLEKIISKIPEGQDKSKILQLVSVMKEGLNLTLEIIKSLRNYTGLNQAKFKELSVQEVVKSVLTILRNKLRDKIEIEEDIDANAVVFGSVVGLNQVFMNLISNAVDAMAEGGHLRIIAKTLTDDEVQIEITDTGRGIDSKDLNRIFEPFFTTKEVGKGTGLGLYIVSNEVKRHRGTLNVKSEVGKGTTFTVRLPRKYDERLERAA